MMLEVYRGGLNERAWNWATLTPEERRRHAVEAAATKYVDALWPLTEAHFSFHAASGVLSSRHTLTSYRASLRALIQHA